MHTYYLLKIHCIQIVFNLRLLFLSLSFLFGNFLAKKFTTVTISEENAERALINHEVSAQAPPPTTIVHKSDIKI